MIHKVHHLVNIKFSYLLAFGKMFLTNAPLMEKGKLIWKRQRPTSLLSLMSKELFGLV